MSESEKAKKYDEIAASILKKEVDLQWFVENTKKMLSEPLTQESQDNWVDLWKEIYLDFQDGEGWVLFAERMEKRFTITRKP